MPIKIPDEGFLTIGELLDQCRLSDDIVDKLSTSYPVVDHEQVSIVDFFYTSFVERDVQHSVITALFAGLLRSLPSDESWSRSAQWQNYHDWRMSPGLTEAFYGAEQIALAIDGEFATVRMDALLVSMFAARGSPTAKEMDALMRRARVSRIQAAEQVLVTLFEDEQPEKISQWESLFVRIEWPEAVDLAQTRLASDEPATPPPDSPSMPAPGATPDPLPTTPPQKPVPPAPPPPPPRQPPLETYTEFVADEADGEVDALDRSVLAISLARQLHRIWRKTNRLDGPVPTVAIADGEAAPDATAESAPAGATDDQVEAAWAGRARNSDAAAFVLHVDAPWGGGKTTFAHFVSRVLNPYAAPSRRPPAFLAERYGQDFNLGQLFLERDWRSDARRPWITVWFNAWRAEDCSPPWWVFYQTIRERCFKAVREEGDEPIDPGGPAPPLPPDWEREERWRSLNLAEYRWRLGDPKIVALLLTALFSVSTALILWLVGAIGRADGAGLSFALDNGVGLILAALTGVSFIWGLGALVTESIVPGSNGLAERLSLGSADPFKRFRVHFARTMEAVRRPVMVVIDDLDRCKPEFIVDLVRGIQTLLQSPRVVFVILGDREWIERAFEKHHEALSKVDVGPEQSLGARFVEKAIQMSFVLPSMKRTQDEYVRRILGGVSGENRYSAGRPVPAARRSAVSPVEVREAVKKLAATSKEAILDPAKLRRKIEKEVAPSRRRATKDPQSETALRQLIDEEVAIHIAADAGAEKEIVHLLQTLAPHFPANPRQIKRIINAMTTYTSVAMHAVKRPDDQAKSLSRAQQGQLAIWIILMTEWPETWRLLASCPRLADALAADDPAGVLAGVPEGALPGSRGACLREVERIKQDERLLGLIVGTGSERPKLDSAAIAYLEPLTPLYRGRRRLREAGDPPAPPPATGTDV